MGTPKLKIILALLIGVTLLTATVFPRPGTAEQAEPAKEAQGKPAGPPKDLPRGHSVIVLWMSGGPSQMDTFDLKPGQANGGTFKEIDTSVKGIRISEHLPKLARHMDHMALVRSLSHREGDHGRGTYLMHTGYSHMPGVDYPELGSVLAKELGNEKSGVPNFVSIAAPPFGPTLGPGYLGPQYGPITIGHDAGGLKLPELEALRTVAKDRAEAWHKAMAEALDLSAEKPATRDAFGKDAFGESCLVARRLVERRVPVIEIGMGGWDTHQNNFTAVEKLSGTLDAGWSALLADLKKRDLLDTTLIVWMGEFGRTPRINAGQGRDHYPQAFTAVLAGGGIKGGQVIGKTNADGIGVAERPVTVPEFLATIYQTVGVDSNKRYKANADGVMIPIVEGKAEPIQEVLPKKAGAAAGQAGEQGKALLIQAARLARLPTELVEGKRTNSEIVDTLFTATLARLPAETEKAFATKHLLAGKDREEACRDVLWMLVNTSEFIQMHSLRAGSDLTTRFHDVLTKTWKK